MLRFLFIFLLTFTGCNQSIINADSQINAEQQALSDEPQKITLCQLKNDPAFYNHKLVEITGFISRGFEDSGIFDLDCTSKQGIWVEYGGTSVAGTMYCCDVSAERKREKPLVVENISTSLAEDEQFQSLDNLLQKQPDSIVRASVIGRFFAGEKSEYSKNTWSGYGHMGCCSLLVIQKVVSVETHNRSDLDYRSSVDQPNIENGGGYRFIKIEGSKIEQQRRAEIEQSDWVFNDPRRVASESLAKALKIDKNLTKEMKQTAKAQGRFIYRWNNKATKTEYMIVVSRPYVLSVYAKNPQKVAWVVTGAYQLT